MGQKYAKITRRNLFQSGNIILIQLMVFDNKMFQNRINAEKIKRENSDGDK